MKIPLKEAIDSAAWFKCSVKVWSTKDNYEFRIRILDFTKIEFHIIDDHHKLNLDNGIIGLLKVEVVNLCREDVPAHDVRNSVILVDQDDYSFKSTSDDHLVEYSDFAKKSGLKRFSGWSSTAELQPKIKAIGTFAYLLPDDEEEEYSLSVIKGTIVEV